MLNGSCLCGSVRYTVNAEITHAENCHCTMCRKAHGAAFSTNALVATDTLDVQGSEHLSSYRSSPNREKLFCSRCGSQLFIKRLDVPEGTVITLATLDDDPRIKPSRHVFFGSKAPWYEPMAQLPQHEIYPGVEPQDQAPIEFEVKLTKRAATPEDISFMLELRKMTMDEHLQAAGMCMAVESHMKRILLAFQSAQVLESAGKPVGILKVTRQGAVWELIQIQLVPDFQGSGIGSRLIEELLSEAEKFNASVRLSVLKSSPARRLYERLGFETKGEDERSFHLVHKAGAQSALSAAEHVVQQR